MRARTIMVAALTAVFGLAPVVASANGGAYISFEDSHHVSGEQVTGELYVSIPANKRHLLQQGPFYAYLLPGNGSIGDGGPLPAGAVRLGTFAVSQDRGETELTVPFTVPDVEGDFYQVGLCNDPCTVSGFGETVSGSISIVGTEREGMLITANTKLHSQVSRLQRDLRKSEREAEERQSVAAASLAESEASSQALTSRVRTLEGDLAAAELAARDASGRTRIAAWAIVAIVALVLASGARMWLRRRRGQGIALPRVGEPDNGRIADLVPPEAAASRREAVSHER